MAHIFVSHSSRDNEAAQRMKDWLHSRGFDSIFLDFDKHAGIPPGAGWERTLYDQIERSEAVLLIQTPNWLESKWCFAEFTQARALGKAIFPVIETPTGETLIARDIQALELFRDREGGLERLAGQLTRIALDAQGGFLWDATRSPFPGLAAFAEDDAAVYFGRDDEIRRLIERLNARRAQGGAQFIALLGSSGSGKSSLLRAGAIPRIRRDHANWVLVPPMRPQTQPSEELAVALGLALGPYTDWRKLHADLLGPNASAALAGIGRDLRVRAQANEARILVSIDQAEELFTTTAPGDADRFFDLLTAILSPELPFMVLMTMRSDFLGRLQSAGHLKARFEEFSLGPLPLSRVPLIIQGPAKVAGIQVDNALVQHIVQDAQTDDALPLIAFALRELYDNAPGDKRLTLHDYMQMGDAAAGCTPLENAVSKAADQALSRIQATTDEELALKTAFVNNLVRVNDKGEYARSPAKMDDLPSGSKKLFDALVAARLMVVQDEPPTIEVTHEALLRKWPRLHAWLDAHRDFLIGKQQLENDLHEWQQAPENKKADALLTGLKLTRIRSWLVEPAYKLSTDLRAFGLASIARDEAEQKRKQKLRRNLLYSAASACVVLLVVAAWAFNQKTIAQQSARELAFQTVRTAWMSLAMKRQSDAQVAGIAKRFHVEQYDLLLKAGTGTNAYLAVGNQNCYTWLPRGFRYMACSLRILLSPTQIEATIGQKFFLSGGLHGDEFNYQDKQSFAHYNPAFLKWLSDYILPLDAVKDPEIQFAYKEQIGPLVRALYHSHQILYADQAQQDAFLHSYADAQARFLDYQRSLTGPGGNESYLNPQFTLPPKPFDQIKSEYLQSIETAKAGKPGKDFEIGEEFRWLADYGKVINRDDWYFANTAGGFWVRRNIDGTDAQIYQIVVKILQTFEPQVLTQPTVRPFVPPDNPADLEN